MTVIPGEWLILRTLKKQLIILRSAVLETNFFIKFADTEIFCIFAVHSCKREWRNW